MANVKVYEPGTGTQIETVDNGSGAQRQVVAAHVLSDGSEVGVAHPLPVDVGANINLGNVTVGFNSTVSTLNQPPAQFTANQVWTGQWEEVKNFASITIAALVDQNSAVNGASAQFSDDGVNVLVEYPGTVAAGYAVFSEVPVSARYFRVKYTNGPALANVRAQIIFNFTEVGEFKGAVGAPTSDLSFAATSAAHVKGRYVDGTWKPLLVEADGTLQVDGSAHTQPVSGTVSVSGTTTVAGTVSVGNSPTVNQGTPAAHGNGWEVTDYYTNLETLADQAGAGSVLTFTFTSTPKLIVVFSSGQVSRAAVTGTPSATNGVYCDVGVATYIPVKSQTLQVYAPVGAGVSVWGMS